MTASYELQIDCTDTGWTSGRQGLADALVFKLPLHQLGENHFRALVFDPAGRPVESAESQIVIVRIHASARGIPATQNMAIKLKESDHVERNTLHIFLEKGTPLPKSDILVVRAARSLKSGEAGHIDIEPFQQDRPEVPRPELNLFIGAFRIEGTDLADGQTLRTGDEMKFQWQMDEGGVLTASAELPSLGLHFEERQFLCAAGWSLFV